MALKRYNRRKRPARRMRRRGNRLTKFRIGNPQQKVFYYHRNVSLPSINAVADSTDVLQSLVFRLDDIVSYAEFTNMYDAYKINAVKLRFLPNYSQVSSVNTLPYGAADAGSMSYSGWNMLRIFSCIDYNDNTAPTSINAMREYSNLKMTQYTKGHTRYLKPKLNLNTGGVQDAVQIFTKTNPWVSSANTSLPFYSLKIGIDTSLLDPQAISPTDPLLRVEATYYVSFKAPR